MIECRLPRTYDPEALHQDLVRLRDAPSAAQPGPYHDGEWTGVSLYSQGGVEDGSAPLEPFAPTPSLARAPYIADLLAGLDCAKLMVRLLTLPPGAEIGEHNDAGSNFRFGSLRLHVPIVTDRDVVMVIDSHRVHWAEGELWWGDFSRPHWLRNDSDVTRVHLVIDVEVDEFVLGLFPDAFVEELRRAPGISLRGPRVPLGDPATYTGAFCIPAQVMPLFGGGRGLRELSADAEASCRAEGDRLVVGIDGRPAFALEHLGGGTFAIVGQPPGVTVQFDPGGGAVTLAIRGVPEDLYAAQLGFQQGPILGEQRFRMPLERAA
jgi:hypothetical protein